MTAGAERHAVYHQTRSETRAQINIKDSRTALPYAIMGLGQSHGRNILFDHGWNIQFGFHCIGESDIAPAGINRQ